jgi:hypothetical protein
MKDSDTKIVIGGNVSESFNVLQDVRHEAGFSAVLFNLKLDKILKELKLSGYSIFYKANRHVLMLMT